MSVAKKNYTKTATFPTAILLVAVLQPYNLYQHLQFPSLSIGNCGSPNLRCGPAVPSSLDSSPLLRCCLALCCSASVELGSTSSCKKAGKAIWMTTTFSNLKTKEVFSSKWDFEQQLQMCMYIYSMHNYILLHTITYSYIWASIARYPPPPPTPWLWVCIVAPQYPPPPCGVGGGGWWWVVVGGGVPPSPLWCGWWWVVVVVVEEVVYVCIWMYQYPPPPCGVGGVGGGGWWWWWWKKLYMYVYECICMVWMYISSICIWLWYDMYMIVYLYM